MRFEKNPGLTKGVIFLNKFWLLLEILTNVKKNSQELLQPGKVYLKMSLALV